MRLLVPLGLFVCAFPIGCKSAEEERREREERRLAREAVVRSNQAAQNRAHERQVRAVPGSEATAAAPPLSVSPSRVLDAENAVRYCEEAWRAHVWFEEDPGTAALRVRKALRDQARVRAGEDVVLESPGGFPGGAHVEWVSGYYLENGVYVPGHPLRPKR